MPYYDIGNSNRSDNSLLNRLLIYEIYFDGATREYKTVGTALDFPAYITTSEIKFNFQTQNKSYAVVQDLPQYVSAINRSYNLSFDVIGADEEEAVSNYIALHSLLKNMKTNFEKTRQVVAKGLGTNSSSGFINNYAINNMAINSKANYRIILESNPLIYGHAMKENNNYSNEYDILLTSFDYKIDTSAGMSTTKYDRPFTQGLPFKNILVPRAFSISMGGLIPPENPNIERLNTSERRELISTKRAGTLLFLNKKLKEFQENEKFLNKKVNDANLNVQSPENYDRIISYFNTTATEMSESDIRKFESLFLVDKE